MNNTVIIFLYRDSVGELNVALPIISQIKQKFNSQEIFFHFLTRKKYNKVDITYKKILLSLGEKTIGKLQFLLMLYKMINKKVIIVSSDQTPLFEYNLIKKLFPNTTTILAHHSQCLLYTEEKYLLNYSGNTVEEEYHPNFFLAGNRQDFSKKYFSKKNYQINQDKVLFMGALSYRKEWLNYLISQEDDNSDSILSLQTQYDKTFLITTRPPHELYLKEDDYKYQVQSILNLTKKFPNILFIIKPHPREKNKLYTKSFADSKKQSNLIISNVNTYKLAQISDLLISFWSSVIQDALIMGTPTLEFHKHNEKNAPLLLQNRNRFQSLFEYHGFCDYVDNEHDLISYVQNETYINSLNKQSQNMQQIFIPTQEDIQKVLGAIEQKVISNNQVIISNSYLSCTITFLNAILNLKLSKFTKKFNKLFRK